MDCENETAPTVQAVAVKWIGENMREVRELCGVRTTFLRSVLTPDTGVLFVQGERDEFLAYVGDWISRGTDGSISRFRSDDFL